MFPPFSEEKAKEECLRIASKLDSGELTVETLDEQSVQRANQGFMIGVLVCLNKTGNEVILRTLSGIRKRLLCENFVEPIVPSNKIDEALLKNDSEIHRLTDLINSYKKERLLLYKEKGIKSCLEPSSEEKKLLQKRSLLTDDSLKKVFSLYSFCCADGTFKNLFEICKNKLPPTGTGDCCAPKLLHHAFLNNLIPLSMAELFYEQDNFSKNRTFFSPCDERCALILPEILGIEIVYQDKNIIVVNKQSGILSVPGRGPEKQDCIVNRVRRLFPNCIEQPAVHRLDMETSGLMVLAFDSESHKKLNRQFEEKTVKKEYVALLSGIPNIPLHGTIELFFRLDVENRPHQIWDAENGKKAITEWQVLNKETYIAPDKTKKSVMRIRFFPHTGRTHQLRLVSADRHGFGVPIIGDSLYGTCQNGERLMLHAEYLSFTHPVTGKKMEFRSPCPF